MIIDGHLQQRGRAEGSHQRTLLSAHVVVLCVRPVGIAKQEKRQKNRRSWAAVRPTWRSGGGHINTAGDGGRGTGGLNGVAVYDEGRLYVSALEDFRIFDGVQSCSESAFGYTRPH